MVFTILADPGGRTHAETHSQASSLQPSPGVQPGSRLHQRQVPLSAGAYDSPESRRAYYDLLIRWERGEDIDAAVQPAASPPEPAGRVVVSTQKLLIAELLERYEQHAVDTLPTRWKNHQRAGDSEMHSPSSPGAMRRMFAADFKPSDLRRVREDMIRRGWSGEYINRSVGRIKRFFNWAVEFEHVGPEVAGTLVKLKGLEQYRSEAKEKDPIESVPDEIVEATLRHFVRSEAAADMVQIQRKCGARPGELVAMQVEEIDRRDPECWWFRPRFHKAMHKGKKREIPMGTERRRRSSSPTSWPRGRARFSTMPIATVIGLRSGEHVTERFRIRPSQPFRASS